MTYTTLLPDTGLLWYKPRSFGGTVKVYWATSALNQESSLVSIGNRQGSIKLLKARIFV